jgi:hypothetical protein
VVVELNLPRSADRLTAEIPVTTLSLVRLLQLRGVTEDLTLEAAPADLAALAVAAELRVVEDFLVVLGLVDKEITDQQVALLARGPVVVVEVQVAHHLIV